MTVAAASCAPGISIIEAELKSRAKAQPTPVSLDHGAAECASERRESRLRWPVGVDPVPVVTESTAIALAQMMFGVGDLYVTTFLSVICLAVAGTYRHRFALSTFDVAPRVVAATAIGATVAEIVVARSAEMGPLFMAVGTACAAAIIGRFTAYALERRLRRRHLGDRRTIVVGADPVGLALTRQMFDDPEYGLIPVALLDDIPSSDVSASADFRVRRLADSLSAVIAEERIETAIFAFPRVDEAHLLDLVRGCDRLNCGIFVVPRMWETVAVNGNMDRIGAIPLRPIRHHVHCNPTWYLKLFVERCLAAVALVTVSPLLALLAVVVKVSDPAAPVLFRQTRVGLAGREFELVKFRSMSPSNALESQTNWTIAGDLRVGPVGRFLRATSLDELPQLWNIVRGDMALVGPRPERPHFVEKFSTSIPGYAARHRVPTGLTGWAAVNGLSGDTSIAERARYDNFYITNWSLWLDFRIVISTVWILAEKARLEKPDAGGQRQRVKPLRVQRRSPEFITSSGMR